MSCKGCGGCKAKLKISADLVMEFYKLHHLRDYELHPEDEAELMELVMQALEVLGEEE